MKTTQSLNSRINKQISAAEASRISGLSVSELKKRAAQKRIQPTKFRNTLLFDAKKMKAITDERYVKNKTDALICQLCEYYPKLSDADLSEMVGVPVTRPKFFIFESKINKR
jgi:hypothetical protein